MIQESYNQWVGFCDHAEHLSPRSTDFGGGSDNRGALSLPVLMLVVDDVCFSCASEWCLMKGLTMWYDSTSDDFRCMFVQFACKFYLNSNVIVFSKLWLLLIVCNRI